MRACVFVCACACVCLCVGGCKSRHSLWSPLPHALVSGMKCYHHTMGYRMLRSRRCAKLRLRDGRERDSVRACVCVRARGVKPAIPDNDGRLSFARGRRFLLLLACMLFAAGEARTWRRSRQVHGISYIPLGSACPRGSTSFCAFCLLQLQTCPQRLFLFCVFSECVCIRSVQSFCLRACACACACLLVCS